MKNSFRIPVKEFLKKKKNLHFFEKMRIFDKFFIGKK